MNKNMFFLVVVLISACAIRLWGTDFGLPYIYHDDEGFEVMRAIRMGGGQFDFTRVFKGGLFYILFVEYGIYYVFLKLFGMVQSSSDFLKYYVLDNPTHIWLIGRYTVALIGGINVYLTYVLAKRLYNETIGIIAAFILAVAFEHVKSSHYITVDILMVTFITMTFLSLFEIINTGKYKAYIATACFAAFAIMTKLPAITVLFPILLACFFRLHCEEKKSFEILKDKRVWTCVGVWLLITAIGNPGFIPAFIKALKHFVLSLLNSNMLQEGERSVLLPFPIRTDNVWLFYLSEIKNSLGLPLSICAVLGVFYSLFNAFYKRKKEDILFLIFLSVNYILICLPVNKENIYSRYILPLLIILPILIAKMMYDVYKKYYKQSQDNIILHNAFLIFFLFLMMIHPTYMSMKFSYIKSQKDTRTIAKEWIEENIPSGATIVIEGMGYRAEPMTVPLHTTPANVQAMFDSWLTTRKKEKATVDGERLSLKNSYYQTIVDILKTKTTYDLMFMTTETLPYYIKNGAEYIIIRPNDLKQYMDGVNYQRYPWLGDFYRGVMTDKRLTLVKSIAPQIASFDSAPTIDIYKVKTTEIAKSSIS